MGSLGLPRFSIYLLNQLVWNRLSIVAGESLDNRSLPNSLGFC
jgi:hypothetical protein